MRIAGNKVLNLKGICINSCCCKFPCVLINIFKFLIFSATMEGCIPLFDLHKDRYQ